MGKKLYVGNLSYGTSEETLRSVFSAFGEVASVNVVHDRETNRSKGFGFVEMGSDNEAMAAISGCNGRDVDGRQLKVNEAMDRPRREGPRW
jgi:RNA recognition motif-containing protein